MFHWTNSSIEYENKSICCSVYVKLLDESKQTSQRPCILLAWNEWRYVTIYHMKMFKCHDIEMIIIIISHHNDFATN